MMYNNIYNVWCGTQENDHYAICEHRRLRSACVFAQSNQSILCCSYIGSSMKRVCKRTTKVLIGLRECTGCSKYLLPAKWYKVQLSLRNITISHWSEGQIENLYRRSLSGITRLDYDREGRIFLSTPHAHDTNFFLHAFHF